MTNQNVTLNRNYYIGGSDMPSILNYTQKYGKDTFQFAKEKAGIIKNTFTGNEHTRYGQLMEPIIREYINNTLGHKFKEGTIINEEKRQRANTDGVDSTDYLLEVKTFKSKLDVDYYTPQCQFYMEHFNKPHCILVGYHKPNDFYRGIDYTLENDDTFFNLEFDPKRLEIHYLDRDHDFYKKLDTIISKFQDGVSQLKTNPNLSKTEFYSLLLGNDFIELVNKVDKIETALVGYKQLKKDYDKIKEKLYDYYTDNMMISYSTDIVQITKVLPSYSTKEEIDLKRLKLELPDLYEKYKITVPSEKKGYLHISICKEGEH